MKLCVVVNKNINYVVLESDKEVLTGAWKGGDSFNSVVKCTVKLLPLIIWKVEQMPVSLHSSGESGKPKY